MNAFWHYYCMDFDLLKLHNLADRSVLQVRECFGDCAASLAFQSVLGSADDRPWGPIHTLDPRQIDWFMVRIGLLANVIIVWSKAFRWLFFSQEHDHGKAHLGLGTSTFTVSGNCWSCCSVVEVGRKTHTFVLEESFALVSHLWVTMKHGLQAVEKPTARQCHSQQKKSDSTVPENCVWTFRIIQRFWRVVELSFRFLIVLVIHCYARAILHSSKE